MLAVFGVLWTQLVWRPCWEAGTAYELSAGVRITLMAVSGGALLLPFLALNIVCGSVWFFFAMYLALYGLVSGLLGEITPAIKGRETSAASRADDARGAARR